MSALAGAAMTAAASEVAGVATGESKAFLSKIAREYGIFGAMVVFFIAFGVYREGQLNQRIDAQDEFIRNKMGALVEANTTAITGFKAALEKLAERNGR